MDLVLDSSPLSCFARANRLDVLEDLTEGYERVVPRAVLKAIESGTANHPALAGVAKLKWITEVPVDTLEELQVFSEYLRRLGNDPKFVGQASVLAWAEVHKGIAVTDGQVAIQSGRDRGVDVKRTLGLVLRGIKNAKLTDQSGRDLVDQLIVGGAHFPCDGSRLLDWASSIGLLDL